MILKRVLVQHWKLLAIVIIAVSASYGWVSGNLIYASYSKEYVPIAPSNISIVLLLSMLIALNSEGVHIKGLTRLTFTTLLIILLYCVMIFTQYFLNISIDIERVFIKTPQKMGNILTGRMSPLTSFLYILICLGYFGIKTDIPKILKYTGGIISLVALVMSSVLFLGYILQAPLLYGGSFIPISLPSTICFILFSLIILEGYEKRFYTLNILRPNKVALILLKSFLPISAVTIIIQALIISRLNFTYENFTLSIAFILISVLVASVIFIYRISSKVGDQLFNAESKLKESDKKYRLIADYNYDWEFWITKDNTFEYNSPSCERISGYTPTDFRDNPSLIEAIIFPEDRNIYMAHLNGHPCEGTDFRIVTKNGDIRWINHVCQPVYDENGRVTGRRGSNSDITLRKNAEEHIHRLNNELKDLNADKDRFISILGHDLKGPFVSLIGFSDLLLKEVTVLQNEKLKIYAEVIKDTSTNTYNLLNEILTWANSKQGKIPFVPRVLNFRNTLNTVTDILNSNALAKNIIIDTSEIASDEVYADPEMLSAILRNLVSNSIKFTKRNGKIWVKLENIGAKALITVSDNGIGIPHKNIARLFDISQIMTTPGTENEHGTGLGLLLCKDFVEKHGGEIWLKSEPGLGSTVSFTLPECKEK